MNFTDYSVAENLPLDFLWEILTRLTCTKSAMRCKAVSKSWLSVISSPQFMGRFLRKHVYGNQEATNLCPPPPFGLIIRPNLLAPAKGQLLLPKNMKYGLSGYFLPNLFSSITSNEGVPIRVMATCNDLILCGEEDWQQSDHMYICNSLTMKWIALPRPLRYYSRFFVGFACDPYNRKDHKQVMKYSVVVVDCSDDNVKNPPHFEAQVYSSLIGKWKEVILWLPKPFYTWFNACYSIFYDGMLYYYNGSFGLFAFDPIITNSEKEKGDDDEPLGIWCHFIDWPLDYCTEEMEMRMTACFCQGNLRLIQMEGTSLSVWDLKDRGTSEWQVKYKIVLTDIVSHDFSHSLFDFINPLTLLGFQPFDDVTLYVCMYDTIVSCNLKTMRLQDIFKIPEESKTSFGKRQSFELFSPFWLALQP